MKLLDTSDDECDGDNEFQIDENSALIQRKGPRILEIWLII